jgi:RNA polymerase sigma-70 factor (ECF subfamily)
MDRLDKRNKQAWINLDGLTETHTLNTAVTEPYQAMDLAERRKALMLEIEKLETPDRLLVDLFYRDDKTVKEIAWIMGIGESNVKIRLHRIRKKLKTRFGIGENDELQSKETR